MFKKLLIALSLFTAACSGAATDGVTDTTQDELGKRKYHYEPSVQNVTWYIGCGVVRPGDTGCKSGLFMTYTKSYIDLQSSIETHVDNKKMTITVDLDTWSYSQIHSMAAVHPEEVALSQTDVQLAKHYHVLVRDRHHQTLWEGDIGTYLAY